MMNFDGNIAENPSPLSELNEDTSLRSELTSFESPPLGTTATPPITLNQSREIELAPIEETSPPFSLETQSDSNQSIIGTEADAALAGISLSETEDSLIVPGALGQTSQIQFTWTAREASFDNEIGVYVTESDGSVNGVTPDDPDYAAAVFSSSQRQVIFASPPAGGGVGVSRQLTFNGGDYLGFYLIQDNTSQALAAFNPNNELVDEDGDGKNDLPIAFFSLSVANPDTFDHVSISTEEEGIFSLAWEDLIGGGDADFNDVLFQVEEVSDEPTPEELPLPGPALKVPGGAEQIVETRLLVNQAEASFNNELGLFRVDNADGEIGNLSPGDEGYANAALAEDRRLLQLSSEQVEPATLSLAGGSYVGSYLIQDGTSEAFLAQNDSEDITAFFSFVATNSDQYDHLRTRPIGEDEYEWAWEDLTGGGDRDFNDFVAQIAFDVPERNLPSLSVNDVTLVEGDDNTTEAEFTVSLSAPSATTVTVSYATEDGTAVAGEDYQSVSETLTFEPGEDRKTVSVPLLGDEVEEEDETFTLNLTNANNATIADAQGVGTIENDDNPPPPGVSAALANDTGVSDSDNLTLDPTLSGQTTNAATLRASVNGGEFIDISEALSEAGDFTLGLEEYSLLTEALPDGDYTITLQAENSGGTESTEVSFTLDRTAPPVPFSLAPESDTGKQGDNTTTEYQVNLIGETEPGLEVILVNDQQAVTANENGDFVVPDVDMPSAGEAPYTMLASDLAGNLGRAENVLTREGLNGAPTITSTPETTLETNVTDTYTYQVTATDPDNDVLSYSLLDAPFEAEIWEDGLLSFTPAGVLQPSYDFTVEVSDGRGGTDRQTFTVEVATIVNAQGVIRGTKWEDLNRNGSRDLEDFDNFADIGNLRIAGDASIVESDLVNGESALRLTTEEEWQAGNALLQTPFDLVDDEGNILSFSTRFQFSISSPTAGRSDEDGFGADGIAFIISPVDNVGESGGGIGYGGLDNSVAVEIDTYNNVRNGTWDSNNGNHLAINLDGNLTPIEQTNIPTEVDTNRFNNGEIWNAWIDYDGTSQTLEARVSQTNSRPEQPDVSANINIPEVLETEEFFVGFTSATGGGWGNHDILSWTFGINEPGLSGVRIYLDANNNGVLDPGEPVQETAEDDPNTPDIDETGQYEFTNLPPSTYTVREVVPEGFEQTFPINTETGDGDGFADTILDYFNSGSGTFDEPYGSDNQGDFPVPVPTDIILGSDTNGSLSLPTGSFVTVGFTDELIVDSPGDDIFIPEVGAEGEQAEVFVSSNLEDFTLLGIGNGGDTSRFDLASIGFTEPVRAIKVVGLDNGGGSPGFDVVNVQGLPGSVASPDFYTVELGEGEVVENLDFGNAEISNQAPVITSQPVTQFLVDDFSGNNIDFETLPDGNVPSDNTILALDEAYTVGNVNVTFGFDLDGDELVDTPAVIEEIGDDSERGFANSELEVDDQADPGFEMQLGNFFLRQPVSFDPFESFVIDYESSTPVTAASGEIWDLDTSNFSGTEQYLIEAFDSEGNLLDSILSPEGLETSNNSSLDGKPWRFNFVGLSDINQVRISFVGTKTDNLGLAFNNFTPLSAPTIYTYDVEASDPDGDDLVFSLEQAPDGMQINADTGLITWDTSNQDLQEYSVTVRVEDGRGGIDEQSFVVELVDSPINDNNDPLILSDPVTTASLETPYLYEVNANDPEQDPLTFSLVQSPEGMEINAETGLIEWTPIEGQLGDAEVTIQVADDVGNTATQQFVIEVTELPSDAEAPQVNLGFSGSVLDLGQTLDLQIQGFDDVGLADLELTFAEESLPLDPDSITNGGINTASVTPDEPGLYEVVATAVDTDGNVDTKSQTVRVIDPNDDEAPVVELDLTQFEESGPVPVITELTDIIATVQDENLEFYRLEYVPTSAIDLDNQQINDSSFTLVTEGNSSVEDAVVGQIDPRLLENGNYFIRVIAQDVSGNANLQGFSVSVTGENKPGRFSLDFTDLSVPLAGVPIEVTRTYDSLSANQSEDFGFGWTLGTQDARIQESVPVTDEGGFSLFTATPFEFGTRVSLTNPQGEQVGFTFEPTPSGGLLGTIWNPRFVPDPGVEETLTVEDISLQQNSDGTFGLYLFGLPYNPDEYQLTTKDGTEYTYSQFDGLQTVEDPNGNTLTYTDDGIISSTGVSVDFVRDGEGRITEIVDPAGSAIEYEYDANGDLVSVTDREGNETTLKYEDERDHYLTEVVDPLGRSGTRTEYDEDGRITRFIDAEGNALDLDFGDAADFQRIEDPLGNEFTLFYDERGNVVREVDPLGGETITTYDENNNILTRTDAEGNTTTFTYDERGNVLTETDALGNTTTFTYNEFNQVLTTTNALGDVATNTYDSNGNLLTTTDAEGFTISYDYDSRGNLIRQTDANNNVTEYGYNTSGLLTTITQVTSSGNLEATLDYDGNGNIASITTPRGSTTTFNYDNEGRLITATDALGNVSTFEYDAAGQRTAAIDALGRRTEFEYNDRGLLTKTIFPDGTEQINEYDKLDRRIATTDPNGNQTQFQYNALGELIGVVDAANNQTTYGRDLVGNLISQTDGEGRTTTFDYDELNRLVTTELPLGQTFTNTYNEVGSLIRTNDFNGDILNYEYDGLGQLTEISTEDNTILESFTYTPTGQIGTIEDERGVTIFEYDDLDRLVRQTNPDSAFIAYGYDGDDNITSLTTPSGTVEYTYDAIGFLDTVTERDGAVTDYEYDAVGNLIETVFPNGVTETLDYNVTDQVQSILTTDIDGNVLASYDYTFDNLGNRLTETDHTGRVTNYDYSPLNQVIEVDVADPNLGNETTSYEYDNAGNLIKKVDSNGETNYTYDDNDRLLQEENNGQVISYNYDDAGNLVEEAINGIITKVYNWNLQGELEKATITEGGTTINLEYQYNSDGIRVSKTVNGDQTKFLIDRNQQNFAQVIEEYDNNGSTKVIYTHGLDLISQLRGSEKGYYHTDALGSTRLLTDSSGNIANTYLYDAYGEMINQSEIQSNSYKFTGEQFDPNLANYYLRARYYDPSTGRFSSRDSFSGFSNRPLSLNDYLYAEGNPINAIDPSGNVALIGYLELTNNKANVTAAAIIGEFQGFGAAGLSFVGNVLEGANEGANRSDNFLEIAFEETKDDISTIEKILGFFGKRDSTGIASAFVGGVSNVSVNVGVILPRLGVILTKPVVKNNVGGFTNGAAIGLEYIKLKIGLS